MKQKKENNPSGPVRQKCDALLELARQMWPKDRQLATRYVTLARKTAMRHRLKLGRKLFCKKCNAPFIPGETLQIRVKGKLIEWKCTMCKNVSRFPINLKN